MLPLCPSLNLTELPCLPGQGCSCPWHRRCPEDQMSPACTRSPGSPKFPVFVPSSCAAMFSPASQPCGKGGWIKQGSARALLQTSHQSQAELSQSLARPWQVLLQHWVIFVPLLVPEQWMMKQPIVQELAGAEHPHGAAHPPGAPARTAVPEGLLVQSSCSAAAPRASE